MIRLTIPVLLAVAAIGCQGQDPLPPMDPFYGQTKIAPPGTGEITRRPSLDPGYRRSAAVSVPDRSPQPPPIIGDSSQNGSPSARLASSSTITGGAEKPAVASGDRIQIPVSARRELTAEEMLAARPASSTTSPQRSADAASSIATSAGLPPQRVIQTLTPRERSSASSHPVPASSPVTSRRGPVDINDLPPVDRGAGAVRDDRVQQASATETETDSQMTVRIPTRVDTGHSPGRFGWADDYSRLRGQLEYLEADRCWKLRYIPVDKKTDDFGGSVVIEDSASLSGFERGDFVEIRGRVAKPPEDGTDFAPLYHVTNIRSLAR